MEYFNGMHGTSWRHESQTEEAASTLPDCKTTKLSQSQAVAKYQNSQYGKLLCESQNCGQAGQAAVYGGRCHLMTFRWQIPGGASSKAGQVDHALWTLIIVIMAGGFNAQCQWLVGDRDPQCTEINSH